MKCELHEFENCEWCSPRTATRTVTVRQPLHYVVIRHHGQQVPLRGAIYHLPDCSEVLWDPVQAKHPGDRLTFNHDQVRELLDNGGLERGCLKCGANVHAREDPKT